MIKKSINKGLILVPKTWMHDHSCRFVYNYYVLVFVDYV